MRENRDARMTAAVLPREPVAQDSVTVDRDVVLDLHRSNLRPSCGGKQSERTKRNEESGFHETRGTSYLLQALDAAAHVRRGPRIGSNQSQIARRERTEQRRRSRTRRQRIHHQRLSDRIAV